MRGAQRLVAVETSFLGTNSCTNARHPTPTPTPTMEHLCRTLGPKTPPSHGRRGPFRLQEFLSAYHEPDP